MTDTPRYADGHRYSNARQSTPTFVSPALYKRHPVEPREVKNDSLNEVIADPGEQGNAGRMGCHAQRNHGPRATGDHGRSRMGMESTAYRLRS